MQVFLQSPPTHKPPGNATETATATASAQASRLIAAKPWMALSPTTLTATTKTLLDRQILTDVCGDVIDNDCDGTIDDEANNACGGDCSAQLGHQPGEACNNGLRGACLRTGTYACQGSTVTVCNAPSATGSAELCDDGVDNDCDGTVDEADAANAPTWFQDCDGDGYSASTVGSVVACKRPTSQTSCVAWTERSPTVEAPDCDDSSAAYHPGAVFSFRPTGKTSFDLDCNGAVTKEPFLRSNNTILPLPVTRICSSPSDCDNCMREFLLNYPIDCTTGHGGTDVTKGEANWVVHHTRGSDGRCYANQDYGAYLYCK